MLGVKSNKQNSSFLGVKSHKSNNSYLGKKDGHMDNMNKSNITSSSQIRENPYNSETVYVPSGLTNIAINRTKSSLEKNN